MAVKKYLGRDCELSTTGIDAAGRSIDSWRVTGNVLRQIRPALEQYGATVWSRDARYTYGGWPYNGSAQSIDCLRHWTSAGQCFYADMAHVEVCTPSCLHPRTFAAQSIATLLAAETARGLAQLEAEPGDCFELSASNADLSDPSISFGSHLSVSVSTALWENLFEDPRYPGVLGFVTSVMAAAIPFFGAGYLFPTTDRDVVYSLSARAHHLSKIRTLATTDRWGRGLLNSRREPHGEQQERLHLIGFDFSVIASALLASLVQCALAAAEEGFCGLILREPVGAMRRWSWGLDLTTGTMPATNTLIDGRQLTLPAYMRELTQSLLNMCEEGLITNEVAPEAELMLSRISDLTQYTEEGSVDRAAVHLDWAAKLLCLLNLDGQLGDAPSRLADHDFSNTNPEKGTLWRLWEQGFVDPLVEFSEAQDCIRVAPPESRDWGRGKLIERFSADIAAVDWSYVDIYENNNHYSPRHRIEFTELDSLNQSRFEHIIDSARDVVHLQDLLDDPAAAQVSAEDDGNALPPDVSPETVASDDADENL